MPLSTGDKLGPYEILNPIGAGGMGEVYRARDTRLRRDVAIKILPAALAYDVDRMARFEREARLLASLDHPNIGAIHGLEENAGTQALILAFVEGPTLAERIAAGPVPLEESIEIARQIAEALEYAHERGVIHRDLKPANVKITPEGTVKVLDFGLAKALTGESESSSSVAASPTISHTLSMRATQTGMILGTAAYMAPEQAKGKTVDRRADIWAFGVVLFEMLTGGPLFSGETIAEILASAIKEEPNLDRLPASTPPAIRRLIERCLHKDPRLRLRDIGEARITLQSANNQPESPVIASAKVPPARKWPWIVAAVMAALAVVALWSPWRSEKPVDRPLVRLDVDLGADVSLPVPSTGGSEIAISPDGTRLAYISGTPPRLFLRRLDQRAATELAGTEGAAKPFFSPDGLWVGFTAGGKLNKISVDGGAAVTLGDSTNFGGASWSEDDSIFVSQAITKGLLRIPPGGGQPETIAAMGAAETALDLPQLLPGGKAILFSVNRGQGASRNTIEVLTLADRRRKVVAHGGTSPRYLPTSSRSGHLIYVIRATMFAVPFDLTRLETRGTPVPVLDDVAYQSGTGASQFDFSPAPAGHGTLVYRRAAGGAAAGQRMLQWLDSSGKTEPLRSEPGDYLEPVLAPDGKRIALPLSDEGGVSDIWVYDPQRDAMTRLTSGGADYRFPVWSPDARYVVFESRDKGILQARADGAGQPEQLVESKGLGLRIPWSFTPDGRRLAYVEYESDRRQIWTVPIRNEGGRLKAEQPEQFLTDSFRDANPSFSPDGRWLAYSSGTAARPHRESIQPGESEVYVRAFPPPSSGPGEQWQISNNGGVAPRWSPNSHDLFYRAGDQIMGVSYSVKGATFVPEKPRVWIAKLGGTMWDLAPDGKRVLVVTPVESARTPDHEHEVVFLENFFDYLRQRAPAGK
jgi:serine/threonine-protein kinase